MNVCEVIISVIISVGSFIRSFCAVVGSFRMCKKKLVYILLDMCRFDFCIGL